MLADWHELRKNVNKPEMVGHLEDAGEPVNIETFIKNFQDTFDVCVNR